jgi:hypothetical protein
MCGGEAFWIRQFCGESCRGGCIADFNIRRVRSKREPTIEHGYQGTRSKITRESQAYIRLCHTALLAGYLLQASSSFSIEGNNSRKPTLGSGPYTTITEVAELNRLISDVVDLNFATSPIIMAATRGEPEIRLAAAGWRSIFAKPVISITCDLKCYIDEKGCCCGEEVLCGSNINLRWSGSSGGGRGVDLGLKWEGLSVRYVWLQLLILSIRMRIQFGDWNHFCELATPATACACSSMRKLTAISDIRIIHSDGRCRGENLEMMLPR